MNDCILYLVLFIVLWGVTFVLNQRKKKYFGASSTILMLYLLISIFSFISYSFYTTNKPTLHIIPFLYLYTCIMIACTPILKYNEAHVEKVGHPNFFFLNVFTFIYLICAFIQIPGIIKNLYTGIILILTQVDAGIELYQETHESVRNVSQGGISNLFSIIFNTFSDAIIIILFYSIVYQPSKKLINTLLFICVAIQILNSISHGARTETTLKMLSFIMAWVTMRKFMSHKQNKLFLLYGGIVLGLVFALIAAVSFSRFGERNGGIQIGTVGYLGQGNINFNAYVFNEHEIRHGDRTANTFKYMLGFDVPNGIRATREKYSYMGIDDSVFYTFVGDFVLDYGVIATPFIFICFSLIFCSITKIKNGIIEFHQLIALYFCICIVTHGSFYLFSYSFLDNLKIIAFSLLYIFFYFEYSLRMKHV